MKMGLLWSVNERRGVTSNSRAKTWLLNLLPSIGILKAFSMINLVTVYKLYPWIRDESDQIGPKSFA